MQHETMLSKFIHHSCFSQPIIRRLLLTSNIYFISCYPEHHIEGETYLQFTHFDQAFIVDEKNLQNNSNCSKTCLDYKSGINSTCDNQYFPCHYTCNEFYDCDHKGSTIHACMNSTTIESLRNYEFIDITGKWPSYCQSKIDGYDTYNGTCDFCICYCDDVSSKSDRYISLQAVCSNFTANEIVTGVRFIKLDRVIHLQIQVGVLLAHRKIDQDTVRWLPIKTGPDYENTIYTVRRNARMDMDYLKINDQDVITGSHNTIILLYLFGKFL